MKHMIKIKHKDNPSDVRELLAFNIDGKGSALVKIGEGENAMLEISPYKDVEQMIMGGNNISAMYELV